MEIIWPLIGNMRDVKRYAASVYGTVDSLDGQVALADVLGLEAVRVFLPDVFSELTNAVEGLTTTSPMAVGHRRDPPHLAQQVEALVEASSDNEGVVRALIERLFPAGQRHIGGSHYGPDWENRWLRNRRVAHENILRLYLERTAGAGLRAFTDAERAWNLLDDRAALDRFLRSLEPERLEDVISSLEAFEDDFGAEHVLPGTTVLLNLLPEIPDRPQGMFDFGPRLAVSRVVLRLLQAAGEPPDVERAARQILSELETLSSKLELITLVGHKEGQGHELVSEELANELERGWRQEVRQAPADDLVDERDPLRVLYTAKSEARDDEERFEVHDDPELTRVILRAAQTEIRRQTMGSRSVERIPRLHWDVLTELFGDEEVLEERIVGLREANLEGTDDLIELAERYLEGWRPDRI